MYTMVCTKFDIAYVVSVVSHFLSNPDFEHWKVVKWILRYLYGTSNLKLYFGIGNFVLCGYSYSDMAEDDEYLFLLCFRSCGIKKWTLSLTQLTKPACKVRFAPTYKLLEGLISSQCEISNM